MLFRFYKGTPDVYVIRYRDGKVAKKGVGLSFNYMPALSTVVEIPMTSQDVPFIFTEKTVNFQEISIQGTLTYRITEPETVIKQLDFSLDPKTGSYASDDPEKLAQWIVNAIQASARTIVTRMSLETALTEVAGLTETILENVAGLPLFDELGVVVEGLHIVSVNARPEVQKALETDYREKLQKQADEAIYARRTAAVENERVIKEREVNTEVELETRRKDLVDLQVRNKLREAEAEGTAEELKLAPYKELPPQVLIGQALKEWAGQAGTIGNLTITPDMLAGLAGWMTGSSEKPNVN